jgi:general secretion pathway protein A
MYERFYGLNERPFELTPNPRYLLLTPMHQEALSGLDYGIRTRRGITLLIGEAGTGKTTLLRKALALRCRTESMRDASSDLFVYVNNPTLSCEDFYRVLADRFGLDEAAGASKRRFLDSLESLLIERHGRGAITALIVDEAQSLPNNLLEEIRLLGNIESEADKLLQIVLAGQPELADRLNGPALRQFKQRIAVRCRLKPLCAQETAAYVFGRIRLAGGDASRMFTREAILAIHGAAAGIPRTISVICDNVLLAGFAAEERLIDRPTVDEVCRDLDLQITGGEPHGGFDRARVEGHAEPESARRGLLVTAFGGARR